MLIHIFLHTYPYIYLLIMLHMSFCIHISSRWDMTHLFYPYPRWCPLCLKLGNLFAVECSRISSDYICSASPFLPMMGNKIHGMTRFIISVLNSLLRISQQPGLRKCQKHPFIIGCGAKVSQSFNSPKQSVQSLSKLNLLLLGENIIPIYQVTFFVCALPVITVFCNSGQTSLQI